MFSSKAVNQSIHLRTACWGLFIDRELLQAITGTAYIVLEAGVVAQQHYAWVGPQALEVCCVCAVPAHQDHCWDLQHRVTSVSPPGIRQSAL